MNRRMLLSALFCMASVCTTVAGFAALLRYESSGERTAVAPVVDFSHSSLHTGKNQTLTVFFHPKCPCSRATLHQLERLLAKRADGLAVNLVFCVPPGADDAFAQSDIYSEARSIPGVNVVIDRSAVIAKSFGAATSGACYLTNGHGQLLFCGGITEGRGHEGNCESFLLLNDAMSSTASHPVPAEPVYGCKIVSAEDKRLCKK